MRNKDFCPAVTKRHHKRKSTKNVTISVLFSETKRIYTLATVSNHSELTKDSLRRSLKPQAVLLFSTAFTICIIMYYYILSQFSVYCLYNVFKRKTLTTRSKV